MMVTFSSKLKVSWTRLGTWAKSKPLVWVYRSVLFGVYLLVLNVSLELIEANADHNWDTLGYVACALSLEDGEPESVHRRTYRIVQAAVPPARYAALTRGGSYTAATAQHAELFQKVLPFYRARLLYIGLIYLFHSRGANAAIASLHITLASFFLTSVLIYLWLARYMSWVLAFFVALGIAHSPPLLYAATFSTPDFLYIFLMTLGFFVLIEFRWKALFLGCLILSILTRPDGILLAVSSLVLLRAFCGATLPMRTPFLCLSLVVTLLAFLVLSYWVEGYGWWTTFYFTFVNLTTRPDEIPQEIDWALYWDILWRRVEMSLTKDVISIYFTLALSLAGVSLALREVKKGGTGIYLSLLSALALSLVVRYLLFPLFNLRLFAPYFLLISMSFLALSLRRPGESSSLPPSTA